VVIFPSESRREKKHHVSFAADGRPIATMPTRALRTLVLAGITTVAAGAAAAPTAPSPVPVTPPRAATALGPTPLDAAVAFGAAKPIGGAPVKVLSAASPPPSQPDEVFAKAGVDGKRLAADFADAKKGLAGARTADERARLIAGLQKAGWDASASKLRSAIGGSKLAAGTEIDAKSCRDPGSVCASDDLARQLLGASGESRLRALPSGALSILSAVPASFPDVPRSTTTRSAAPFPEFDASPARESIPSRGAWTSLHAHAEAASAERKTVAAGTWVDLPAGHKRVRAVGGASTWLEVFALVGLAHGAAGVTYRLSVRRDGQVEPLCTAESTWGYYVPVAGAGFVREGFHPAVTCSFERDASAPLRVVVVGTLEAWTVAGGVIAMSDVYANGSFAPFVVTTSAD